MPGHQSWRTLRSSDRRTIGGTRPCCSRLMTDASAPKGGRRHRTSRIKNSPQQMLEEINANIANCAEFLAMVDPAAIEPETVRRLTVSLRTSANVTKRYAHSLEQYHAQKKTPEPAATDFGGPNQNIPSKEIR